jgi:hypothetical protein
MLELASPFITRHIACNYTVSIIGTLKGLGEEMRTTTVMLRRGARGTEQRQNNK